MIDILVVILLIMAIVLGIKRGFVAQLCHLVGVYVAILIAPKFATEVGMLVMDDVGKAYLAGFIIIVAAALILIWIIAPLIKALVVWKPLKFVDALFGALLNVATMVIVLAAVFSIFDRINIGPSIRQEALVEIVEEHSEGDIKEKILELAEADIDDDMRQYFEHRYISYELLEESKSFYPLARLGRKIIPSLQNIDNILSEQARQAINEEVFFNF